MALVEFIINGPILRIPRSALGTSIRGADIRSPGALFQGSLGISSSIALDDAGSDGKIIIFPKYGTDGFEVWEI